MTVRIPNHIKGQKINQPTKQKQINKRIHKRHMKQSQSKKFTPKMNIFLYLLFLLFTCRQNPVKKSFLVNQLIYCYMKENSNANMTG